MELARSLRPPEPSPKPRDRRRLVHRLRRTAHDETAPTTAVSTASHRFRRCRSLQRRPRLSHGCSPLRIHEPGQARPRSTRNDPREQETRNERRCPVRVGSLQGLVRSSAGRRKQFTVSRVQIRPLERRGGLSRTNHEDRPPREWPGKPRSFAHPSRSGCEGLSNAPGLQQAHGGLPFGPTGLSPAVHLPSPLVHERRDSPPLLGEKAKGHKLESYSIVLAGSEACLGGERMAAVRRLRSLHAATNECACGTGQGAQDDLRLGGPERRALRGRRRPHIREAPTQRGDARVRRCRHTPSRAPGSSGPSTR